MDEAQVNSAERREALKWLHTAKLFHTRLLGCETDKFKTHLDALAADIDQP